MQFKENDNKEILKKGLILLKRGHIFNKPMLKMLGFMFYNKKNGLKVL